MSILEFLTNPDTVLKASLLYIIIQVAVCMITVPLLVIGGSLCTQWIKAKCCIFRVYKTWSSTFLALYLANYCQLTFFKYQISQFKFQKYFSQIYYFVTQSREVACRRVNFQFWDFYTNLWQLQMLHFDVNPIKIGYLFTDLWSIYQCSKQKDMTANISKTISATYLTHSLWSCHIFQIWSPCKICEIKTLRNNVVLKYHKHCIFCYSIIFLLICIYLFKNAVVLCTYRYIYLYLRSQA